MEVSALALIFILISAGSVLCFVGYWIFFFCVHSGFPLLKKRGSDLLALVDSDRRRARQDEEDPPAATAPNKDYDDDGNNEQRQSLLFQDEEPPPPFRRFALPTAAAATAAAGQREDPQCAVQQFICCRCQHMFQVVPYLPSEFGDEYSVADEFQGEYDDDGGETRRGSGATDATRQFDCRTPCEDPAGVSYDIPRRTYQGPLILVNAPSSEGGSTFNLAPGAVTPAISRSGGAKNASALNSMLLTTRAGPTSSSLLEAPSPDAGGRLRRRSFPTGGGASRSQPASPSPDASGTSETALQLEVKSGGKPSVEEQKPDLTAGLEYVQGLLPRSRQLALGVAAAIAKRRATQMVKSQLEIHCADAECGTTADDGDDGLTPLPTRRANSCVVPSSQTRRRYSLANRLIRGGGGPAAATSTRASADDGGGGRYDGPRGRRRAPIVVDCCGHRRSRSSSSSGELATARRSWKVGFLSEQSSARVLGDGGGGTTPPPSPINCYDRAFGAAVAMKLKAYVD